MHNSVFLVLHKRCMLIEQLYQLEANGIIETIR